MKIAEMNWMQVAEYLKRDDRAVVPLDSTEQHAYLSLSTDSILAERVAVETRAIIDTGWVLIVQNHTSTSPNK
jgi:creatinine amidohydrolase